MKEHWTTTVQFRRQMTLQKMLNKQINLTGNTSNGYGFLPRTDGEEFC